MSLRRLLFVGLSACLLFSSPAFAEKGTLMEVLFPKAEKAEGKQETGKKKLSSKEKAKQQAAKLKAAKEAAKKKAEAKLAAKAKGKQKTVAAVEPAEKPKRRGLAGWLPGVEVGQAPETDEPEAANVAVTGNNGELRSEKTTRKPGLFSALFRADEPQMLPETRALDRALAQKDAKKKFQVKDDFLPQEVEFSGYKRGTIVIDTGARYLYLVQSGNSARRYAIAVGRDGLQFKGKVAVGDKQEWPRWIPTKEMQAREPKKYGQWKDGMPGGPENPLGARAIYLHLGKKDTYLRIHGTNQPQSIGSASSNGCFRMVNEHVMDLYRRVPVGTQVIVM